MNKHQTLKWIMSLLFLGSAVLLSSNVEYSKIGFLTFFLGHLLGLYIFHKEADRALFWHNIGFSFIDAWGIYRWFLC